MHITRRGISRPRLISRCLPQEFHLHVPFHFLSVYLSSCSTHPKIIIPAPHSFIKMQLSTTIIACLAAVVTVWLQLPRFTVRCPQDVLCTDKSLPKHRPKTRLTPQPTNPTRPRSSLSTTSSPPSRRPSQPLAPNSNPRHRPCRPPSQHSNLASWPHSTASGQP